MYIDITHLNDYETKVRLLIYYFAFEYYIIHYNQISEILFLASILPK
jgi:hypothetical protein